MYLDTQADLGIAKHMGGLKASRELFDLCRIVEGDCVLDVGCGIGLTACRLVKELRCEVVGIDISEKMAKWSKKNAKAEGIEGSVEFLVGDAFHLPFRNETSDAVLVESVNAFIRDKPTAMAEYVRIAKHGQYVGLNEATWLATPPPQDLAVYISSSFGTVEFLTSEGWRELLEKAGLNKIKTRVYRVTAKSEVVDRVQILGVRRIVAAWWRLLTWYIFKPGYRKFLKEMLVAAKKAPKHLFDYWGYGVYVGRKTGQSIQHANNSATFQ